MQRDCPVCDAPKSQARHIGSFEPTHWEKFSSLHFGLEDCRNCGLIYLNPAPNANDLEILYVKSDQFSDAHYTDEVRSTSVVEYMLQGLQRALAHVCVDPGQPLRVLEIGAGLAWMCRAAKASSIDCITVAQDVTAETSAICPWVDDFIVGDVNSPELRDNGPYHIASMTHVIEHLVDPVSVLSQVCSLLVPGGVLFVTAPHRPMKNIKDTQAETWQSFDYFHVPGHTQYFSKSSMTFACKRAGLELLEWDSTHEGGEAFEALIGRPLPKAD